jgi:chitin deacetylase
MWNNDTDDWNIGKGQTLAGATAVLTKAYKGPKSPGLNILEHELSPETVKVFIDTYPLIAQNGWTAKSIPDVMGASWYLNAADNTSPVTDRSVSGGPNGTSSTGGSVSSASVAPSATDGAPSAGSSASATSSPSTNGAISVVVGSSAWALSFLGVALLF